MSFLSRIKRHFKEIGRTKKSAHAIALGAGMGTLIGTLPLPFIDFLVAFLVILIFKKISKYALFGAILIWNPLIKIPIYAISYKIGSFLFKDVVVDTIEFSFWENVYSYSRSFLVGNFILSILLTLTVYFGVYFLVRYLKEKKLKRMKKKGKIIRKT